MNAKQKAEIKKRIAIRSRVQREALVDFMLNGTGFAKLPGYTHRQIANPAWRALNDPKGWDVPTESLGRLKGDPTASTAESIRIWITDQHLGDVVNRDQIAVICENDKVTVYRKVPEK